jgi:hypothetical protein
MTRAIRSKKGWWNGAAECGHMHVFDVESFESVVHVIFVCPSIAYPGKQVYKRICSTWADGALVTDDRQARAQH